MPVNRQLWKRSISKHYIPAWPCPACGEGKLQMKKGTMNYEETRDSRLRHSDDDFLMLDVEFVFSANLECARCKEIISCCGVGGYDQSYGQDEDGDIAVDYTEIFFPRYFSRAMKIFECPHGSPKEIKISIEKSLLIAFCDSGAAANHIRQCAEEILSQAGISGKHKNGGFIRMEQRIEAFRQANPRNAGYVDALRWIGNFGSHPEDITKDDVFDAYDILELLLEDLYVGHRRSVEELVNRINQSKRPVGRAERHHRS